MQRGKLALFLKRMATRATKQDTAPPPPASSSEDRARNPLPTVSTDDPPLDPDSSRPEDRPEADSLTVRHTTHASPDSAKTNTSDSLASSDSSAEDYITLPSALPINVVSLSSQRASAQVRPSR